MGKTALGTNIAFNCADKFKEEKDEFNNNKVTDGGKVDSSLEMSSEQLATRILAERSKISSDKCVKQNLVKMISIKLQDFFKARKFKFNYRR